MLGVGSASKAGPTASGSLATVLGSVEPPGPAAARMETEGSDASNPCSVEGDSLLLDLDLYDADSYDIPDPGLLKEKNGEVAWRRPRCPRGCRHVLLRPELCLPRRHPPWAVP